MWLALTWSIVAVLLALWSAAAWAFNSVANWMLSSAGSVGAGTAGVETWQLPAWLAAWLPAELSLLLSGLQSQLAPFVEFTLLQMPALAGGLSVMVWAAWGIGTMLLVLAGLAASAGIVLFRSGKLPWKR